MTLKGNESDSAPFFFETFAVPLSGQKSWRYNNIPMNSSSQLPKGLKCSRKGTPRGKSGGRGELVPSKGKL